MRAINYNDKMVVLEHTTHKKVKLRAFEEGKTIKKLMREIIDVYCRTPYKRD